MAMELAFQNIFKGWIIHNIRRIRTPYKPLLWSSNKEFDGRKYKSTLTGIPLLEAAFESNTSPKIAFIDRFGQNFTYEELCSKSFQLSDEIKELTNLESGMETQVAFLCPRDSSFLVTLWATWISGNVAVPLPEHHPDNLLEYMIKNSEADLVVTTSAHADQMEKLTDKIGCKLHVVDFDRFQKVSLGKGPRNVNVDNALLVFTSGSSGPQKVKVWSNLLSEKELRPNVLMGVPTVYSKLIEEYDKTYGNNPDAAEFVKSTCLGKMRLMTSGSASLPLSILKRWEEITGHRLLERYGMTETGMNLTNPLHGIRRPGYVGLPSHSVHLRITDLTSPTEYDLIAESTIKDTVVYIDSDEHVSGDVLIKGPSVMKEYWKDPETSKNQFTHDGWFITGDTAEFVDGAFKILGRTSTDIIKSGGYKLSAVEIETLLSTLDEVKEISVFGVDDPTWGQKVAALIVWEDKELNLEEFRVLAKKCLPRYARPTIIKSVKELPKDQFGKVNRKELATSFSK